MKQRDANGITLIALVITIIVLLILAGVTIATLTGDNGIIGKAGEAKENTIAAGEKEAIELAVTSIKMNNNKEVSQENLQDAIDKQIGSGKGVVIDNENETFTVKIKDNWYIVDLEGNVEKGVNWDLAKENTKAPEEQTSTSKSVIGIGTDGKAVNMDLWKYTLINEGTEYGLNSANGIDDSGASGRENGYIGEFTAEGRIIGTVPQYISEDGGKTFLPVTSLVHTFYQCTGLKIAPEIPTTVNKMKVAFYYCTTLEVAPAQIPYGVTDLNWTFCATKIASFNTKIPKTVTSMRATFQHDSALKNMSAEIPDSVIDIAACFSGCRSLIGTIIINANVTGAVIDSSGMHGDCNNVFLDYNGEGLRIKGTCKVLEAIRDGNEKITIIK